MSGNWISTRMKGVSNPGVLSCFDLALAGELTGALQSHNIDGERGGGRCSGFGLECNPPVDGPFRPVASLPCFIWSSRAGKRARFNSPVLAVES